MRFSKVCCIAAPEDLEEWIFSGEDYRISER